ncbi:MAG: S1C family serine protease [Patescibacteria group bacterium]
MKREIVPTSPKYQNQPMVKNGSSVKYRLNIWEFLFVILLSVFGGLVGGLIFDNASTAGIISSDVKEIITFQDNSTTLPEARIKEALAKIEPSVVEILNKDTDDQYLETDILASGVILTSDGWLAVAGDFTEQTDLIAITSNNKVYDIEQSLFDVYSGVSFLKCTGTGLLPAAFASNESLAVADQTIAVYNSYLNGQRAQITWIENISYNDENDLTLSQHPDDLLISSNLDQTYLSAPLINMQGEVIGLNLLNQHIVKQQYFTDIMAQVISNKTADRISLDFVYNDLSRGVQYYDEKQDKYYNKGVLINNVVSSKSHLLAGDIVLKVDDQEINKFNSLNDILSSYKPEEVASFSLIRNEKEIAVDVEL